MKILFIILVVYLAIAVLAFIVQAIGIMLVGSDSDQATSKDMWKMILINSISWLKILIKLVVR